MTETKQERRILLALADHADPHGRAWPSQRTLAERGRCSVRTVQRHLNAMEKRGLIRRGDQRLVAHLRGHSRPIVWDLAPAAVLSGRRSSAPKGGGRGE